MPTLLTQLHGPCILFEFLQNKVLYLCKNFKNPILLSFFLHNVTIHNPQFFSIIGYVLKYVIVSQSNANCLQI